ncbi:recombinase family protein [Aeromonas media]|uniref:recombinase family protein n=1 Tax=Aeromonas media TaxID=651 RepID=UPI003D218669
MRVYAYLRASTDEQDATRAKSSLEEFATDKDLSVSAWFVENESGASLQRPKLFQLLEVAQAGDVLLIEQVDRLSRLSADDWGKLRKILTEKGIKVVALDLPTSHVMTTQGDEFTTRMFTAINSMMLDMLAAVARKDYTDRRRRQAQGITKAKAEGKFKGRQPDTVLRDNVMKLLEKGMSYTEISEITGAARSTISRIKKNVM